MRAFVQIGGGVFFGLLALAGPPALAQDAEPDAEPDALPNVGHTRHEHPHNPPHPVVGEGHEHASRFFTDRASPVVLPLPEEEDAFFFVIFGDRTGGPDEGVSVLADAVRDTNLLEPDLVMTVGDLIQGYNETPGWLAQMTEYKAIMDNLLCPWFPVAGNHDTYWRHRGGGETRPEDEHEPSYELHFGPLWYSFRHKGCEFIVLYSDEGDPDTGERSFRRPESQTMSPEQKRFLQQALDRGADADHVFVFLHHPRWLRGGYGDDWDNVHEMLVEAGNVSAVFAGHIHRMRADGPRDGIEYFTLATVGGHQRGTVPDAGFRHHYQIVTVREGQVAISSVPVGEIMDPRDITGALSEQTARLASLAPRVEGWIPLGLDGSVEGVARVEVANPTDFEVDFTLTAETDGRGWSVRGDHAHGRLEPGESRWIEFPIVRAASPIDEAFRPLEFGLRREVLTRSHRYAIPETRTPLELNLSAHRPAGSDAPPDTERVLRTGYGAAAIVPSDRLDVPEDGFTLECWFNADRFGRRVGLVSKTESSEFGIFVSNGTPDFSVHLDGRYVTARDDELVLEPGRWYHVAGVYTGREVRLYIDGRLIASAEGSGERRRNDLPLVIGADVDRNGRPTSYFEGRIDEVRIMNRPVYRGEFTPVRRHRDERITLLRLTMDRQIGPWVLDHSGSWANATLLGATVEDD